MPRPFEAEFDSPSTRRDNADMVTNTVIVDGTLFPDGKLQLDETPNVAPGRVTVFLQPAGPRRSGQAGLAEVIDEIRKRQHARGFTGRSAEEIDAACREGEDEYEQRMAELRHAPSCGADVDPS